MLKNSKLDSDGVHCLLTCFKKFIVKLSTCTCLQPGLSLLQILSVFTHPLYSHGVGAMSVPPQLYMM